LEGTTKNRVTVLVVDDETGVRALCESLLAAEGYNVRVAANGVEALEILASGVDVDCVVVDLIMPKMGGITMAMKLHEVRPALPTVIISGQVDLEASSIKALTAMMNSDTSSLIRKPFTNAQLIDAVHRALARGRQNQGP
jgi:DNA-binding NtrC family response regulator